MNGHAMYSSIPEPEGEKSLVSRHVGLVKRIAYHLVNRLPPSVQVEDLIQAGMVGLLEAASHFDPSQGASFETYAGIRIRGAMLDEIRRSDWTPRSVHRKARQVAEAVREIENRTGRDAKDGEVVEALGINLKDYHQILVDSTSAKVFSFDSSENPAVDQSNIPENSAGPLEKLTERGFHEALAKAIEGLPDRERLVMSLYYDDELNLREIGEILGVSESRVCQIHGQAVTRLRARMAEWTAAA
jgi:RNA polymerase sigma factor for flagellar operon FliA